MSTRTGIRKAFSFKRPKRATPEETAIMLPKLKLIKAKHAARVQELTRAALKALEELSKIEAEMDIEATKEVCDDYHNRLPEFKLTFEALYAQHAEENDETSARLDDCMDVLEAIQKEAADAVVVEESGNAGEEEDDK